MTKKEIADLIIRYAEWDHDKECWCFEDKYMSDILVKLQNKEVEDD